MKKKGQINQVGVFIMIFVAAIVGIALFLASTQQVGLYTSTVSITNQSITTGVNTSLTNATASYFTQYQSLTDVVIYNATNATGGLTTGIPIIAAENYTVTNNVVYNGGLAVSITPNVNANDYLSDWQISGTAEPVGYISGAGRTIALLIPIFMALAILIVMLIPTTREQIFDYFS